MRIVAQYMPWSARRSGRSRTPGAFAMSAATTLVRHHVLLGPPEPGERCRRYMELGEKGAWRPRQEEGKPKPERGRAPYGGTESPRTHRTMSTRCIASLRSPHPASPNPFTIWQAARGAEHLARENSGIPRRHATPTARRRAMRDSSTPKEVGCVQSGNLGGRIGSRIG